MITSGETISPLIPVRRIVDTRPIIQAVVQEVGETRVFSAQDCLVMLLAHRSELQLMTHGDQEADRIRNVLERHGYGSPEAFRIGASFCYFSPKTGLFNARLNLVAPNIAAYRTEADLINGYLKRHAHKPIGLDPIVRVADDLDRGEVREVTRITGHFFGQEVTASAPEAYPFAKPVPVKDTSSLQASA
jgi:hypothetical protein